MSLDASLFVLSLVLAVTSQWPQVARLIRLKRSYDVSLATPVLVVAALGCGGVLAWRTGASMLVVGNYVAGVLAMVVVLALVIYYRTRKGEFLR